MPQSNGPYVNYAAVCERVLHEADGVLSLIRIIDQVTLTITTATPAGVEVPAALHPAPPITITFALGLKSGERTEAVPVKVRIDTPHRKFAIASAEQLLRMAMEESTEASPLGRG